MTSRYSDPAYDGAIAVIGMALRLPQAETIDAFWKILREGKTVLRRFTPEELQAAGVPPEISSHPDYVPTGAPLANVENFDAGFFGFTPREAACLSPQNRLLFECAWEALELAGYDPMRQSGRTGIFVGQSVDTYWPKYVVPHLDEMDAGLDFYSNSDYLATGIAYKLNLRGPAMTVQSFCSTSLLAVHMARQALLEGECDIVLAGGTSIRVPQHQGHMYVPESVYSPDGKVRTFDAAANGTQFGNGVGVVALKRLADALEDGDNIEAIIRGSAANNDGNAKAGYNAPSVDGQARAIARAIKESGVSAQSIGYVECHGTGTAVGDPIEIAALTKAFRAFTDRRQFCAVGSVKPNIGHVDRAAGVIGLIKTALSLRHGEMPAVVNFRTPNPRIDFPGSPFFVSDGKSPFPETGEPRRAGVNSLGYGGTNVHVVMEQPPARPVTTDSGTPQVLVLSARTAAALEESVAALADHLEETGTRSLTNVAFTLQVGRHGFNQRHIVVAKTIAEAISGLRQPVPAVETTVRAPRVHITSPAVPLDAATVEALCRQAPALRGHLAASGNNAGRGLTALLGEWGIDAAETSVREPGDVVIQLGTTIAGPGELALLDGQLETALMRLLGRLWLAGVQPDWNAVHGDNARLRVALPTARFQRQRHWLDPKPAKTTSSPSEPVKQIVASGRFAEQRPALGVPSWRRLTTVGTAEPVACCIVVLDNFGIGSALADSLEAAGETVIRVQHGAQVANIADGVYTADFGDSEQLETLLNRLKLWGPTALVCCTTITAKSTVAARSRLSDRLKDGLSRSFFSPRRWIKAVAAVWPSKSFQIDFVSRDQFQVSGADPVLPEQAALAPLVLTAIEEYANLRLRCIEIDPQAETERLAAALSQDVRSDLPVIAARRGRQLWVPTMDAADLSEKRLGSLLRKGGTYLMTGGLGGIGYTIAYHLAAELSARLVIVTRQLPETGEKAARLQTLKNISSDVVVFAADVADEAAMSSVLNATRARFGRIDGVLHAAGQIGDLLIEGGTETTANAVMAAKTVGTAVLLDILAGDPPDFLVLCSSMAAIKPTRGQADYAAANAFLDAVAQMPDTPMPVLSVNWNSWRDLGGAHEAWLSSEQTVAITEHAVFHEVRSLPNGSLRYAGHLDGKRHWVVADHLLNGRPTLPGSGVIDLILEAYAHHCGGRDDALPVSMAPVVFLAPLSMSVDEGRDIVVTLEPTDEGFHALLESIGADGRPVLHARASIRPLPGGVARAGRRLPPMQVSALPARPTNDYLHISGRWDCLREIAIGSEGGRAVVTLPSEFDADTSRTIMHPALLDMATSALAYRDGASAKMPIGYEALTIFAAAGRQLTSIADRPEEGDDGIVRLSLNLADAGGRIVAEVDGLIFAPPETAADAVVHLLTSIADVPRAATNPFLADSIAPEEGLDIFLRLPIGQAPQVLVSSRGFTATEFSPTSAFTAQQAVNSAEPARERPQVRPFLAQIWQRILGVPLTDDSVSFFEMGGSSLGATRVLSQIRDVYGLSLSMRTFFSDPTPAALATAVEAHLAAGSTIKTETLAELPSADTQNVVEDEDAWETGTL